MRVRMYVLWHAVHDQESKRAREQESGWYAFSACRKRKRAMRDVHGGREEGKDPSPP